MLPVHQVRKGQTWAAELLIEPDTEVVQRYPGRQPPPQTLKLVGPLSAKAEGIVELLVDGFYDLADARCPPPQSLRPTPLTFVALGWTDDPHPVSIEPSSVVVPALEALVEHVGSRGRRSHALQPLGL